MAYSIDFRRKVLGVRERERLSITQVAQRFAVGKASVMRWLKQVERKPSGFRRRKLDLAALEQDLRDYPDAYQRERAARLGVTQNAICYALKRKLRVSYKKNISASARGCRRAARLSSPSRGV
ncbi:MAG: transposase [Candidatus Competibacter sp.]|nr:transposase [Candidatus Competibacter sp.]